ncbi:MAG: response regulator, partial [Dehalococcoidia bacterium]
MLDANLTDACILIVDDEEANVDLLEQMLARAGYSNLMSTTDSREVLPLYRAHQPDLILLDLLMPHLDGFTVMEHLRQEVSVDSYQPILVLTAMTTPDVKRRALDTGATDFLTKP